MPGNLKFRYEVFEYEFTKTMEFDLKWVHVARYELILRQDEAIWLRIISEPLPTPKRVMKG